MLLQEFGCGEFLTRSDHLEVEVCEHGIQQLGKLGFVRVVRLANPKLKKENQKYDNSNFVSLQSTAFLLYNFNKTKTFNLILSVIDDINNPLPKEQSTFP